MTTKDRVTDRTVTAPVPQVLFDGIEAAAQRMMVSKSAVIRIAVADWLRRQPQTPGPQSQNTEA